LRLSEERGCPSDNEEFNTSIDCENSIVGHISAGYHRVRQLPEINPTQRTTEGKGKRKQYFWDENDDISEFQIGGDSLGSSQGQKTKRTRELKQK